MFIGMFLILFIIIKYYNTKNLGRGKELTSLLHYRAEEKLQRRNKRKYLGMF